MPRRVHLAYDCSGSGLIQRFVWAPARSNELLEAALG
jgi:hypothetical protein